MEDVVRKLRFAGQARVLLLDAPPELSDLAPAFAAAGATVDRSPHGAYPFVLVFARSRAEADAAAAEAQALLEGDGLYWFAYPKGSSKRYSADINRDSSWGIFEPVGLRPVAQVALDADWSALRMRRAEYVKA